MTKKTPKHRRKYPKAFQAYWDDVEYCGINEFDDFKHEAYLAWKAGTQHGPIRKARDPAIGRLHW